MQMSRKFFYYACILIKWFLHPLNNRIQPKGYSKNVTWKPRVYHTWLKELVKTQNSDIWKWQHKMYRIKKTHTATMHLHMKIALFAKGRHTFLKYTLMLHFCIGKKTSTPAPFTYYSVSNSILWNTKYFI